MIGKINTRILNFLDKIIGSFEQNNALLRSQVIGEFTQSQEYSGISTYFRSPVRYCKKFEEIRIKIAAIDKFKNDPDFIQFWQNTRLKLKKYTESYQPEWDEKSYLIIPVIVNNKRAGLTYLTTGTYQPGIGEKLSYSGLPDKDLEYKTLTEIVVTELYLVTDWPFGLAFENSNFTRNYYKLYFKETITTGNSMSAALVALFCIEFCRNFLGKSAFNAYAAPLNGLLITGVVSEKGKILPVDGVNEKIETALEEFGPEIRVIVPKSSKLNAGLFGKLPNLIQVETVEELFEAVLSSNNPNKGLKNIRVKLFEKLIQNESQKNECLQNLKPGISSDVYTKLGVPGYNPFDHIRQKENVFYSSGSGQKDIYYKMSVNSGLLQTNHANSRTTFMVILDGSYEMNHYWQLTGNAGVTKMGEILYAIQDNIQFGSCDLFIGFLSSRNIIQIPAPVNAKVIDQMITGTRRSEVLEKRGAYFRPVYETIKENFLNRQLKVFLLSDSVIYDLDDLKSRMVFQTDRRYLKSGKSDRVLDDSGNIHEAALNGYFDKSSRIFFKEITIHLGKSLPLCWNPHSGSMTCDYAGNYSVTFSNLNYQLFEFDCRMAYESPKFLKIDCKIDQGTALIHEVSIEDVLLSKNMVPPDYGFAENKLSPEDKELWKKIYNSSFQCPKCGNDKVHLHHVDGLTKIPVFRDVKIDADYFLICIAGDDRYYTFKTGIQVENLFFIYLNGNLHCYSIDFLRPFHAHHGVFQFIQGSRTFYASKF